MRSRGLAYPMLIADYRLAAAEWANDDRFAHIHRCQALAACSSAVGFWHLRM